MVYSTRLRRSAFTLIELLVVMAIIATLAALTISATMRIISVQDEATTKTLIKKTFSVFEKQWQAVIDKAWKEPIPANVQSAILTAAGGDAQRARVIYVKLRLKQEFPMSKAEVTNPTVLPALPTYAAALGSAMFATAGSPAENSACLVMALSQARSGIIFNPDDLGPNALTEATTNNSGMKMIVDAWGQPVVFFRWPTWGNTTAADNPPNEVDALNPTTVRNATPQTKAQLTLRDSQDPLGLLYADPSSPTFAQSWWKSANRPTVESWLHSLHNQANQPYEYYMVPVIASGGPNKALGLNFPDMSSTGSASNDNIYSYDRK